MDLDAYSSRFLQVLSRAFPEVVGRAKTGPDEGCFAVELPTAAGTTVVVSTEDFGRITVAWDVSHAHFGG